jgi:signal transduction histidine kinase
MTDSDALAIPGAKLCVLIVEDSQDDTEIVIDELRASGYAVDYLRVDTEQQLRAALPQRAWQLVLCDIVLPQFDAWRALEVVHEWQVDIPFIVVSGSVSEETAILMMKAGAHDFVLKGNLARLPPAVDRELREAAVRAESSALREQLLLSDRLVQVGTLAASVAHEINNPLAYVMGNLEYALHELASPVWSSVPTKVIEALSTALEGAQRIRATTDDLRVFARTDDRHPHAVNLKRVLESSIGMAATQIRYRARLIKELEDVPAIAANENHLGQVFLNLLVNAAQAIPEGQTDEHEIRVRLRSVDEHAEVEVSDTGSGIAPEVRKRLFQPFVTTKPKHEGTGLGLSICRRIVRDYRGEISARANSERGTTFVVRLPLLLSTTRSLQSLPPPSLPHESRRARLLVIDDEPEIVDVIRRELAIEHETVGLTSCRAALALLNRDPSFELILCDLMMPGMNGMQLYTELERTSPELVKRIVFITGGAFTQAALKFLEGIPNPNITKPFDADTLLKLVRMALARVAGTRRILGAVS